MRDAVRPLAVPFRASWSHPPSFCPGFRGCPARGYSGRSRVSPLRPSEGETFVREVSSAGRSESGMSLTRHRNAFFPLFLLTNRLEKVRFSLTGRQRSIARSAAMGHRSGDRRRTLWIAVHSRTNLAPRPPGRPSGSGHAQFAEKKERNSCMERFRPALKEYGARLRMRSDTHAPRHIVSRVAPGSLPGRSRERIGGAE